MTIKRSLIWKALLLAVVLAMLATPVLAASDVFVNKHGTIEMGKQGLFVAVPGTATNVQVDRVKFDRNNPAGVSIRDTGIAVMFQDAKGHERPADSNAYVYFNMSARERRWFDQNKGKGFQIWVLTPNKSGKGSTWSACPATLFTKRGDNGGLACRITANATYFLGSTVINYETKMFEK